MKSRCRRFLRLVAVAAYTYVGVLVVLLALENYFLFPRSTAVGWVEPPRHLRMQDVDLTSADGTALHAWWCVPPGWTPARGAVLFSHGNGGNVSHRASTIDGWRKELGRAVLCYDYPGYGRSAGAPSEAGCYAACEAAYQWLVEKQQVPPAEIVLVGESLGGAMSIELATHHECRMIVTCSTFTSFPDMAQKSLPWFHARWVVGNNLDHLATID